MLQNAQLTKWTERSFRFGYAIDFIPFLIERLSAASPRIAALIASAAEEELTFKPGGKWSAKEHIGHLTDLEDLHEGRLLGFQYRAETLRAADMTNRRTEEANHNHADTGQLLIQFQEARRNFFKKMQELDHESLQHRALHPRLRQMINVADLLYFMAEHDNHHLTVMAALLRSGS